MVADTRHHHCQKTALLHFRKRGPIIKIPRKTESPFESAGSAIVEELTKTDQGSLITNILGEDEQ